MAEKVQLKNTVQDKESFSKVISTEFNTFREPTVEENNDTVEELFRLYGELYLEIPLEGPRSHTYLIEESSKLVEIGDQTLDIQPLLDEISDLRQRLLLANEQIFDLETQLSNASLQV